MLNLPSPPSPPPEHQQTNLNLAVYYRQLVEYHQQAVILATEQMFVHLQALLDSDRRVDNQLYGDEQEHLDEQEDGDEQHAIAISKSDQLDQDENPNINAKTSNNQYPTTKLGQDIDDLKPEITRILTENKGKVLHIDYILWELYGYLEKPTHKAVKKELNQMLSWGHKQDLWYLVPDSPDCWTLDLEDFPDLAPARTKKSSPQSKIRKSKKTNPRRVRFPYSEQLDQFVTLDLAIEECLIIHYPDYVDADKIIEWLYPHGISPRQRKQVRNAIIETLELGENIKSWKQTSPGYYVWDSE